MLTKKKIILISVIILALALGATFYYRYSEIRRHTFRVTFLNIGQGDSALINFGNGEKMLVDCGPDSTVLFRLGSELPFYDRTIDYLVATHPDRDHYGGCSDVLQRYNVKHIILNGHEKNYDAFWRAFRAAVAAEGAPITIINGYQQITVGSSTLEFYSPDDFVELPLADADSNNYSIVFKLISPTRQTFLFTGDMEIPLERALIKKYCGTVSSSTPCPALQAEILKVGHHGSGGSTGDELLAAVAPKIAVISVGKNHYGHPSLRVIRHLERAGTKVFRTDELGNIAIP